MSLVELLPDIQSLLKADKLRLYPVPGTGSGRSGRPAGARVGSVVPRLVSGPGVRRRRDTPGEPARRPGTDRVTAGRRFPFVSRAAELGDASLAPMLPLTLVATRSVAVSGLLDTGATVNVLPRATGTDLGFDWDRQTTSVRLSGNLAMIEARAVVVSAVVEGFAPVRLAFAWAKVDAVPVILGQVNFFLEFDVCFFQSRRVFEVRLPWRVT